MAWAWQGKKTNRERQTESLGGSRDDKMSMTNGAAILPPSSTVEATRAHCLRVATWASELAGAIGLSDSDRTLVERAAIAHHIPELLVDDDARLRMLSELHIEPGGDAAFLSEDVQAVLETLRRQRPITDPVMGKMVAVLEISDDFDQFFESEPLFNDDAADECTNSSVEAMMSYLQVTSRADVARVIDRLPVFPRAAREVVRKVANPDVGPLEMEEVASLDPVLAGRLIQTANSAFYSPQQPIGSICQAVSFVGTEVARRVLLAAAIRSNFASPEAHRLWNHSLDVAQIAEKIAEQAPVGIDPAQAFLTGLIHDIGRLSFAIMPVAFQERYHRLTDGGCPAVEVETCLSGRSHAEVGAETLAQWNFPADMVEAVRMHHRPEKSSLPLTSLLYLAELLADSEEDLPSWVRTNTALRLTGLSMKWLTDFEQQNVGALESMRFAA